MHAVVFERNGGPEVLDYKEVPDPSPRDGQVLVDVEAVGINFRDVYEREGRDYGSRPPAIIGVEGAGTVVGTGAREAGADEILGYEGFAHAAREIAGREGVAAVYDGVGKTTFYEGLEAIRPLGRMIVYGAASGQPDPLPVLVLSKHGSLYVQRPTIQTYIRTPELLRERASRIFELVQEGKLRVRIGARYPLAQARQAHIDLQARQTTGKVLLLP